MATDRRQMTNPPRVNGYSPFVIRRSAFRHPSRAGGNQPNRRIASCRWESNEDDCPISRRATRLEPSLAPARSKTIGPSSELTKAKHDRAGKIASNYCKLPNSSTHPLQEGNSRQNTGQCTTLAMDTTTLLAMDQSSRTRIKPFFLA